MNKIFTLLALAFNLCLYAQPGSLDLTFNNLGKGVNGQVFSVALQSDGKIIIGGWFTKYNDTTRNHIARLNTDGSLDTTFNPSTGANDNINAIAIQSDGKIVVVGDFTEYNGTARNKIARLNTDGSLDASLNPGTGAIGGRTTCLTLQSDEKILIGGSFTSYNGTVQNSIARLNTDGSLDTTFKTGKGANNYGITKFALQSDGKIIIVGDFSSYNNSTRYGIARIKSDGSLDGAFNPLLGANGLISSIALQSDEKIIIGGKFTTFRGNARNGIARLNKDCSLDTTFNPGTGANDIVWSIALQDDGNIVIGGDFTTYNGTTRIRLARLNADGSLNIPFNPDLGASYIVFTTAIQSDGKVIVGGSFSHFNGTPTGGVTRLNKGRISNINTLSSSESNIAVYPNPANNFITVKLNPGTEPTAFTITNQLGQAVLSGILTQENNTVNITTLTAGMYFLKSGEHNNRALKLIKE